MPLIPDEAHRIILPDECPIYPEKIGKVRHNFELDDQHMLIISSDRVSTFDAVHPTAIPDKGKLLTALSVFWLEFAEKLGIEHHLITADIDEIIGRYPELAAARAQLDGRSMLVHKADVVPIEAIVRGNLTGSGLRDYRETGKVCGLDLPAGLQASAELDPPLFTPSTKAEEGHDENITFDKATKLAGREVMEHMRDLSLKLFANARTYAAQCGLIVADTKFEWGQHPNSTELMLVDEVLTSDSSRLWAVDQVVAGDEQPPSFDKQLVRNDVTRMGWNKEPPAPALSAKIVDETRQKYIDAYEMLTGKRF